MCIKNAWSHGTNQYRFSSDVPSTVLRTVYETPLTVNVEAISNLDWRIFGLPMGDAQR